MKLKTYFVVLVFLLFAQAGMAKPGILYVVDEGVSGNLSGLSVNQNDNFSQSDNLSKPENAVGRGVFLQKHYNYGDIWFSYDTDRPGGDYKKINMRYANPNLCKQRCDAEKMCNAWTYVKPGIQAKNPVCRLKKSVPAPVKNRSCCISGVKNIVALAPELFKIKERWGRMFRVKMCAPGFIGSSKQRFGWKSSGLSIGGISPPFGAHGGVLWLYPISPVEPAIVVGKFKVKSPKEAFGIRIAGERRGNFQLAVLVDNHVAFSGVINGKKWRWVSIPVGKYYGRTVDVKLICGTTKRHYEYAFIDDIKFTNYTSQKLPVQINKFIGCFKDRGDSAGTNGRDLNGYILNSPRMTPGLCRNICFQKGFVYAGLQYSSYCFCGNSYGKFGRASNCNMKCSGDKTKICGGVWANSVYKVR